jgi:hypothetical protein
MVAVRTSYMQSVGCGFSKWTDEPLHTRVLLKVFLQVGSEIRIPREPFIGFYGLPSVDGAHQLGENFV